MSPWAEVHSDIVFDRPLDTATLGHDPTGRGVSVESFGVAKLQPEMATKDAGELVITPGVGIGPVAIWYEDE